jgi:8-oxo-dGTP diphosphatase
MDNKINEIYGNKLRVRVCGLCWNGRQLLVVNHKLSGNSNFWAPPGGGVEFGEPLEDALIREFQEEAGITVRPVKFMFGCELLHGPLHAIELFYEVHYLSGQLTRGYDPESSTEQLIQDVKYFDFDELMAVREDERHGILRFVRQATDLKNMTGFYRI